MPRSTPDRAGNWYVEAPGQLTAADNLEAILVVDDTLSISCQSTGTDKLVRGQWVVRSVTGKRVRDYGAVLRRNSRLTLFGYELPSVFRFHKPRHIVLPSKKDVLALNLGELGEAVGEYSIVIDKNRRNPTEHLFATEEAFDANDAIFRGTTPPTPTFWLPEFITNPIFIAPMAADVQKEVVIKAYRLWGDLEPLQTGICSVDKEQDNTSVVRYRALFLLYGRGNAIRDSKNKLTIDPVCLESAVKVSTTGGRRAGASSKLAFFAQRKARTTL
ncbi:MAG: hypothetical protein M1826_001642 [Phylliscum demangeonii]|nr:MAG: hypothetical protein M1826_001642 [Phylliscum demangeonii]